MNQLYHGDNLAILREMPDASVDLICTDPPFNTGKDWGAFNDKWEGGIKGYLKFMEPRCEEMRRVLKDTGSLYLHCDPTASHYLKVMLDGVFGIKQFRNEIVLHKICGNKSACEQAYKYPNRHDIILLYAKGAKNTFHKLYEPLIQSNIDGAFTKKDENGRLYNRDYNRTGKIEYLDEHKGKLIGTFWEHKLNLHCNEPERTGYPTAKIH